LKKQISAPFFCFTKGLGHKKNALNHSNFCPFCNGVTKKQKVNKKCVQWGRLGTTTGAQKSEKMFTLFV